MGFIASASVVVAGLVWGLRLIIAPGLFADGAGALLAVALVAGSTVAGVGLVVSRGRWARRFALGMLGAQAILAAFMELDAWGWVTLAFTAVSVVLVAGPWLDGFLRQLPPADPPPTTAVVLALGLLLVPGAVAVSSPGGLETVHWVAAGLGLATAWAFGRALGAGLWSARVAVPLLLLAAGLASPLPGLAALTAVALGGAWLAWWPATELAVNPIAPRAEGVAVPPQLVPPDVLTRAGLDDRGRPIKPER
ncbi:MAG: hypothetical protein ACR2OI_08930 [Acidimicrobiia bacterium]